MKVSTLGEYIDVVENIIDDWKMDYRTTVHPWYRGQSNASWDLVPSIYRNTLKRSFEREMARDFILKAGAFTKTKPEYYLEWLYIMQHYGLPTRLLDWSESYLFALYFSVQKFKTPEDSCVWILDPWSLNDITLNIDHVTIPTVEHDELRNYELKYNNNFLEKVPDGILPIAIRPIQNNPRILAQKGTFTVHGAQAIPINNMEQHIGTKVNKIRLRKIQIAGSSKKRIYRELFKSGITPSVVFPELSGLADELKIRYSGDYTKL